MESLVEILFVLSSALLLPVVVILLGFVAWVLMEIGGFAREAQDRYRQKGVWRRFMEKLSDPQELTDRSAAADFFEGGAYPGLLGAFSMRGRSVRHSELHLRKLTSDLEIEAAGRLARMSLGVRVGPMLGLMGTLIPLGPALIGLSAGDLDQMTRSLVVAFSTTVLGLFVGGVCYGIWLVRRQWYAHDLSDIEFVDQYLHAAGRGESDVSDQSQ